MDYKFKKGDVVIVKKNTSYGFDELTVCRVEGIDDYDWGKDKVYLLSLINDERVTQLHFERDLKKVKEWDK